MSINQVEWYSEY